MKITAGGVYHALGIIVGWGAVGLATFMIVALLQGCTMSPKDIYTPQEVDVPVDTPCKVKKPAAPDWALQHVALTATMTEKVKGALSEIEQHKGYEDQLNAAIDGCQ